MHIPGIRKIGSQSITSGTQSTIVVAIKIAKTSDLATRCETPAEVVGTESDGAGDGAVDGSRLLGAWVVGFPVGRFEGTGEGIEDEVGPPVGDEGTLDGGMVDGKPVGDADGMPVVSERHREVASKSLQTGVKA